MSELLLQQCTTSAAKTPPPVDQTSTANNVQNTTRQSTTSKSDEQSQQQRLQLYCSLFGQEKNKICHKTGLQFTSSLNYSLYKFLLLTDSYWVLSFIDASKVQNINKLNQIGIVVKNFIDNNPNKLKAFKCDDLVYRDNDSDDNDWKNDIVALLIYCDPKLEIAEKYILKLIKEIEQQTNEIVFVGIAKRGNIFRMENTCI